MKRVKWHVVLIALGGLALTGWLLFRQRGAGEALSAIASGSVGNGYVPPAKKDAPSSSVANVVAGMPCGCF